jgi:hypothetical protein
MLCFLSYVETEKKKKKEFESTKGPKREDEGYWKDRGERRRQKRGPGRVELIKTHIRTVAIHSEIHSSE